MCKYLVYRKSSINGVIQHVACTHTHTNTCVYLCMFLLWKIPKETRSRKRAKASNHGCVHSSYIQQAQHTFNPVFKEEIRFFWTSHSHLCTIWPHDLQHWNLKRRREGGKEGRKEDIRHKSQVISPRVWGSGNSHILLRYLEGIVNSHTGKWVLFGHLPCKAIW